MFGKLNIKGITKNAKDKTKQIATNFVKKTSQKKCSSCGKK